MRGIAVADGVDVKSPRTLGYTEEVGVFAFDGPGAFRSRLSVAVMCRRRLSFAHG